MPRLLCTLLALALLPPATLGQSKKRPDPSRPPKTVPAPPTMLNRKAALRLLQSVVPSLYDSTRYKSARISVPFKHYRTTSARLRVNDRWVRAAEELGWVTLAEGRSDDPYTRGPTTTVSFTAEGARLFDGSTPGYACEGGIMRYCKFRVAEIQVLSIVGIRLVSPTLAQVVYVWVYAPLAPLHGVRGESAPQQAAATFGRFDDGWRITDLGLL